MSKAITKERQILFITGLSGAGISTALKALEDTGYEVFDNFPLNHIESLMNESGYENTPLAFGLDTRTRNFSADQLITLAKEIDAKIIFLSASNHCLQQRFSETRRVHPLAKDRTVLDGIIRERKIVQSITDFATETINTTELTLHDFKQRIQSSYPLENKPQQLTVTVMSFGFKHGIPRQADIVMDVRFLKNPHWNENLRPLSGKDSSVGDYINTDPEFGQFIANFKTMLEPLLPRYMQEGKSYLTIAFGCTGGRHRSVYTTEKIGAWLADTDSNIHIRHRDLKD